VETDTFVYAAQTMSHGNAGGPPPGPGVSVNIFQWDNCAQIQLMAAFGFATPTTLQMDRKLSSGAVTATVPMQDYVSNNTFTVSVNVSWTGTGPVSRQVYTGHFQGPGFSGTNHFQGTLRNATATGSVNDGTTEWAASPADYAQLFSSTQGYVTITTS